MVPVRTLVVVVGMLANATLMGADIRVSTQLPQGRDEITVRGLKPQSDVDYLFTFNTPVALPGVALGAGTYLFSRITSGTIQVSTANRERALAMVQTIPTVRATATKGHQIVFGEAAASGAPRPIKAWFLPEREIGQELIYPKWQTAKR